MGSAKGGVVSREDVLKVLAAHGVDCYPCAADASLTTVAKDDVLEAYALPAMLGRSLIGTLARKFNIPAHHFFHPEALATGKVTPLSAAPSQPSRGKRGA